MTSTQGVTLGYVLLGFQPVKAVGSLFYAG